MDKRSDNHYSLFLILLLFAGSSSTSSANNQERTLNGYEDWQIEKANGNAVPPGHALVMDENTASYQYRSNDIYQVTSPDGKSRIFLTKEVLNGIDSKKYSLPSVVEASTEMENNSGSENILIILHREEDPTGLSPLIIKGVTADGRSSTSTSSATSKAKEVNLAGGHPLSPGTGKIPPEFRVESPPPYVAPRTAPSDITGGPGKPVTPDPKPAVVLDSTTSHLESEAQIKETHLSLPKNRPYFHSLGLNPGMLEEIKGSRKTDGAIRLGLNSEDLKNYLHKLRSIGVETLVVGFLETADHFYYKPIRKFSYLSTAPESTVSPSEQSFRWRNQLVDGSDFLSTLFAAAKSEKIGIVLSVSPLGDARILEDLTNKSLGLPLYSPETATLTLELRLARAIASAKEQAIDLQGQFGTQDAFQGWFLGLGSKCMDQNLRYWKPLGTFLRSLAKNKSITGSADIHSRSCTPTISLKALLQNSQESLTAIAYRDGTESATFAPESSPESLAKDHYNQVDCDGKDCREAILRQLPKLADRQIEAHKNTNIGFAFELEGTRRKGPCPGQSISCFDRTEAHPWSYLERMLEKESPKAPKSTQLILDGGLWLFNFGIENAQPKSMDTAFRANQIYEYYLKYLIRSSNGL